MKTQTAMLCGGYVILMSRVKDIRVKVIPSKVGNDFIKKHHYSGKVASTGLLNFGFFLDNVLVGAAQFGRPINKYFHIGIVKNTGWNEFLELNRFVLIDEIQRNAESRVISICLKLIKKNAPHIKWVMSYADAIQCGDGTIYRASGFKLLNINKSGQLYVLPNGETLHLMALQGGHYSSKRNSMLRSGYTDAKKYMVEVLRGKQLTGNQLKYIYLIDKTCKITVPILPFSKIKEMGASMYKGKRLCDVGVKRSTASFQDVGGGAIPTTSLHLNYA